MLYVGQRAKVPYFKEHYVTHLSRNFRPATYTVADHYVFHILGAEWAVIIMRLQLSRRYLATLTVQTNLSFRQRGF